MESEFSPFQVAVEDDSLLQQIPEDDDLIPDDNANGCTTARNDGYFLCSPLVTNRPNGFNASPSATPSTDVVDKENIDAHNLEVPKLSAVQQQMKKKKKGGGYNLRKSIAWNRAFFTEEGVLNPLELSMITGSSRTTCLEALTTIDEGTPTMCGGDHCNDLFLEDKLLKNTSTSTPSSSRKNGRGLLPKRGSSTKDNVKIKEPSVKDVHRSTSKRGCPPPVASLSAIKFTNLKETKTMSKVEKISRIPARNRDPTIISRTLRSAAIRSSDPKSKQVVQRVGINPRKAILKDSSTKANGDSSKIFKAKTSIQQPRRKLHELASDSNKLLEVASCSSASKFPLFNDHDESTKGHASFLQNAPSDGGSMLNQIQMAKPSGLRMPSPSMAFFGPKKVAPFQSPVQHTSRPGDLFKSMIPNLRAIGAVNSMHELPSRVHGNFVKADNSKGFGESSVVSCLSSASSIRPTSCDEVKSMREAAHTYHEKVNVANVSPINLRAHELENAIALSLSNHNLGLQDISQRYDELEDQIAECNPCDISFNNFASIPNPHPGNVNDLGSQGTPRAFDDQLNRPQQRTEQSWEQCELKNSSEIRIRNSLKRSRTSKDFELGRFNENVDYDSHAVDKGIYEEKDEALETHKIRILQTIDAAASDLDMDIDLDRRFSIKCNNTMQSNFALSNLDSAHIDDDETTSPITNIPLLQRKSISPNSQQDYGSHINEVLAEGTDAACGKESKRDIDLCLIPHSSVDACLDNEAIVKIHNYVGKIMDTGSDIPHNSTCLELERKHDDIDDLTIPSDIDSIAETSPKATELCTSDTENQQYGSQPHTGLEHIANENEQKSHVLPSFTNDSTQRHGLPNSCVEQVEVSSNNNQRMSLDKDAYHINNTPEEYKKEMIASTVLKKYDVLESNHIPVCNETHLMRMDDKSLDSVETEAPPPSSSKSFTNKLSKKVASEVVTTWDDLTSLTDEVGLTVSNDPVFSRDGFKLELNIEAKFPLNGNGQCQNLNDSEMEHPIDTETCSTTTNNDAKVQLRKSEDNVLNPDTLVIKTSTNAVPFSEEWLAAIEAAGEEILTIKSGAVQNSPPDKSQPEPGPWSPVKKKKNQGIGPFDCTKYTNNGQPEE